MDFDIGDVLSVEWDEHPLRVLMTDEIETFYDVQMPEVGWIMARARTVIYYRTTTSFLGSGARLVRKSPFTPAEIARHRPDLPRELLLKLFAALRLCVKRLPFGLSGFGRARHVRLAEKVA